MTASETTERTTVTTPRQTVEAFLAAFRLKDVDAALTTIADDARVTVFPLKALNEGKDVVRTLLQDIVTAFPDLHISEKDITDVGRVIVAELKIEGTQAADFLGAINQEKHLDIDTAWRFTVDGDHISALEAYWCQNQLYRRLAVKRQDQVTIV